MSKKYVKEEYSIKVYMTKELKEYAEKKAAEEGLSTSAYMRRFLVVQRRE